MAQPPFCGFFTLVVLRECQEERGALHPFLGVAVARFGPLTMVLRLFLCVMMC